LPPKLDYSTLEPPRRKPIWPFAVVGALAPVCFFMIIAVISDDAGGPCFWPLLAVLGGSIGYGVGAIWRATNP
jgi:4'-phosphopantetheinyl transferase EntD